MSDNSSNGKFTAIKSETSKRLTERTSHVSFNSEAQPVKLKENAGTKLNSEGVKRSKPQPQATYELTPFGMKRTASHAGGQQPSQEDSKQLSRRSNRLHFLQNLDKASVKNASQSKQRMLSQVATRDFGR